MRREELGPVVKGLQLVAAPLHLLRHIHLQLAAHCFHLHNKSKFKHLFGIYFPTSANSSIFSASCFAVSLKVSLSTFAPRSFCIQGLRSALETWSSP